MGLHYTYLQTVSLLRFPVKDITIGFRILIQVIGSTTSTQTSSSLPVEGQSRLGLVSQYPYLDISLRIFR